jgi:5-methylcytosine-specific restriction endonuclease McrA
MVIDNQKHCPRCSQTLHVDAFYKLKRKSGDGHSGYCKKCMARSSVEWQKSHPDEMKTRWAIQSLDRRFKREQNGVPEEKRISERGRGAAYRDRNREKVCEASRKSKARQMAADPETVRANNAMQCGKRRCLMRGYPTDITIDDWRLLLSAFDRSCAYCGGKPKLLDLDHIYPIHLGGFNVVGNIVPICRPCNSQKSRQDPKKFSEIIGADLDKVLRLARVRDSEYPTHTTELTKHGYA